MLEIPCKEITRKIIDRLRARPTPKQILAAILIGKNPASISFIKQKEKIARELGVDFRTYEFRESISQNELLQEIGTIVNQKSVGGVIIQLPLSEQFNSQKILNVTPIEKDIDVLGEQALEIFNAGKSRILPPAVEVVKEILKTCNLKLETLKIAVIGTGQLVGRPIAVWLKNKTAELAILNSKTENLQEELKNADIIISGAGKANLFSSKDVKENAIVIDFGYSLIEMSNEHGAMSKKLNGDFNYSSLNTQSSSLYYTPTPGGTGPILVAKIIENFYKLNESE